MKIIDGKKIRDEILVNVKKEISLLKFQPVFCDVLVGDDPASVQYVNIKARTVEMAGIRFHNANFPLSINTDDLIKEIKILNKIPNMCGIIVQLPLPSHLDRRAILDAIDPQLDVDCLGTVASEKFYKICLSGLSAGRKDRQEENTLGSPAALACMALIDSINLNLKGKIIVVLGQGELVGKPVAALLRERGLNFQPINKETVNKENFLLQADVIISGIGKGKFITSNMVKFGVVLIDAGTSEEESNLLGDHQNIIGDVDFESVRNVAGYVSPVPGGVGPVTVAMLLNNVLTVAKNRNESR